MQNLDVISINLWNVLISLCNLLILFFILKKFLYAPIRRVINERNSALCEQYSKAKQAQAVADERRLLWEEKLQNAKNEADEILNRASEQSKRASEQIISSAKENAAFIIKDAQKEADAEFKKAQNEIKKDIVDISAVLTEKLLNRELNTNDHHAIINDVISEMGDINE